MSDWLKDLFIDEAKNALSASQGGCDCEDLNFVTSSGVVASLTAAEGATISVDGETEGEVTLIHQGKNLLPALASPLKHNDVTATPNVDGTIRIAGTTGTNKAYIDIAHKSRNPFYLPPGKYKVSSLLPNSDVSFAVYAVDYSFVVNGFIAGCTHDKPKTSFEVTEGSWFFSHFSVIANTSVDVTVWGQVERVEGIEEWTEFEKSTRYETTVTLPATVTAFEGKNILYTKGGDVLTVRTPKSEDVKVDEKIEAALKFDASVYGLPVLTLDGNCTGMTKDDSVNLAYTFMGMKGNVDVKKQGSSSINTGVEIGKDFDTDLGGLFNFTLKFPEAFEAKEGWGAQKKYCFKANAIDHSHARNICSCKLWGEIVKNRANVPAELSNLVNGGAIDGFPIVIVLNGNFYALGTFNIPKDGWMFGTPKAILCADDHTEATQFKALATLSGDFELEYVEDENNSDWVLTSINTAIQAVLDSDGSDLDTTVGQYIDIPSAIDYYIHTVDENADDGTDKNYILVTFDGVKWYFSAYDRDTVYGIRWNGKSFVSPVGGVTYAHYSGKHKMMNLIYNHKKADLKARAIELRDGIKSEANVATVFTNFAAGIPAELFAQNCRRWPLLRSTSVSNVAQILNWYRMRRQVIDKELEAMD